MKRSNRSFLALHMGHMSGGASLAHRYPQTLHRHTGSGRDVTAFGAFLGWDSFRSFHGGRRSGMAPICFLPFTTSSETYRPQ
jgi:hypothetical protein